MIAMVWERDTPDDVTEDRRRQARSALAALNRALVSPRNGRAIRNMRPWHRGIYLSYSNMAADSDWRPMGWQVEILEGVATLYCSELVTGIGEDKRERLTI